MIELFLGWLVFLLGGWSFIYYRHTKHMFELEKSRNDLEKIRIELERARDEASHKMWDYTQKHYDQMEKIAKKQLEQKIMGK